MKSFFSPAAASNYRNGYSSAYGGYYPTAGGAPSSYGYTSYAQQAAIQTYQRQQQISTSYARATGNKGIPKTKETLNLLGNWNKSMKETWTKFCTTAPKAKKDKHQSTGGVALSPGATWSLPAGGKVIGKTTIKILGKAVWI